MSPQTAETIARLRRRGAVVFGPSQVSMLGGPAVPGALEPGPGAHVQIGVESRFVEGFGVTADQAVQDALTKLAGLQPTARTRE